MSSNDTPDALSAEERGVALAYAEDYEAFDRAFGGPRWPLLARALRIAAREPRADERAENDLILLALAIFSLERPGMLYASRTAARRFGDQGPPLFEEFRRLNSDRYETADEKTRENAS